MEHDVAFAAELADGGDVLDDADFVVDVHDADEDGVVSQRGFEFVQVDQAVGFGVKVGDFVTFAFQLAAGVEHGFVFGFAGDDVFAVLLVEVRRAFDREVVGFGGAGGKDDFTRVGADQVGDVPARLFDRGFGGPAKRVTARGRVAVVAAGT